MKKKFDLQFGNRTGQSVKKKTQGPPTLDQSTKELLTRSAEILKRTQDVRSRKSLMSPASGDQSSMKLVRPSLMKVKSEDLMENLFDIEEDPFTDLFDIEGSTNKSTSSMAREGKRQLRVTLEYDPSKISGYSELLMECIAGRGLFNEDFDMQQAISIVRNLGQLPGQILIADEDRWQMFIFSVEFVRLHGSPEDWHIASLHPTGRVNPDFDPTAENVQQDGRTIGGVDLDPLGPPIIPVTGEAGLSHRKPATVREAVEKGQKYTLELNRPKAVAAPTHIPDEGDREVQLWRIALEYANKPRVEWENKVDWMLEQRIKYCYRWLRDIGEVPTPYPKDMLDLFWPVPSVDNQSKDKVVRRHEITAKVIGFWRKSVAKNGTGIDLTSQSYRTTLAAMALQKAIENYVTAGTHFNISGEVQDKEEEILVQKAAKIYFQSHFPISMFGADPGPLSTMDPDYMGYVRLCRQYKIEYGTLLHEVKL